MNKWWEKKKKKTRKGRKNKVDYTFWDLIVDVLIWLPELILLPFRIVFWSLRGIGRLIGGMFDIV